MKASFVTGFILGIAAVLAAAWLYPWVNHVRIPSRTSVVANGGRGEQFLIRLPADKVAVASNLESGPRLKRFPDRTRLPDDVGDELVLIEQFKIRDSSGDVIGVASRHTVEADQRIQTVWNLFIPSRGAMLLRGDAAASMLDRRLEDAGLRAGEPWAGDIRVPPPDAERASGGELIAGTGEFDGLTGRYGESWQVTGVSVDGELRGTIQLNTVSSRAP
jgi:hypothetical protein